MPASASSSRTGMPRSSRHPARWAARTSCPRTSATARTTAASGSPTRSAKQQGRIALLGVAEGGSAGLLALTRFWRRSLARACLSDADVHLLLLAACSDNDRHAGRVIDPVPARDGQPSAAARVGAVADLEDLAGRTRRTPPDA